MEIFYYLLHFQDKSTIRGYRRGFNRIWGSRGIDEILAKPDAVFIVRFHSVLEWDEVLRQNYVYLDKKALIMKAWFVVQCIIKDMSVKIPMQVTFSELDLNFWSREGLSKITGLLDRPLVVEKVTQDKAKIRYAHVLVEMDISEPFSEQATSMDENGNLIMQQLDFKWRPLKCTQCDMFGHTMDNCRKKIKRIWRRTID